MSILSQERKENGNIIPSCLIEILLEEGKHQNAQQNLVVGGNLKRTLQQETITKVFNRQCK